MTLKDIRNIVSQCQSQITYKLKFLRGYNDKNNVNFIYETSMCIYFIYLYVLYISMSMYLCFTLQGHRDMAK